jgi:hypothetical protein
MFEMSATGKTLVFLGIVLIIIGAVFIFGVRLPWLGRLPGDIFIQRKGLALYFPITTSLVVSVVMSIIFMLLRRR